MIIEPQKEGESLEDRVSNETVTEEGVEATTSTVVVSEEEALKSMEKLAEDFMTNVEGEDTDVEMDEDNSELVSESTSNPVDSEDVREGGVDEPISVPVGPADYSSPTHIGPQVLEEATAFLDKYGIKTTDLSPKEVMDKIEKIKAAKEIAAQVLSRGRAIDGIERLLSFVPEGYIGEFKRENDMDISRAKALGFTVFESDEANLESSTGKSDGLVRLGDQLLMVIPEETYVANRLVKAERLAERRKAHDFKAGAIDQKGSDPLFPLIEL